MFLFTILMAVGYLIGSVNTSIVYSLNNFRKDIRSQGSGNAGTTNMLRSFGKVGAAVTFLGDILKAVISIGIAWFFYRNALNIELIKALVGLACVIGHCFPIFFQFKGGKGIATGAGCVLMLDWRAFLVAISLFALVVCITRYVSLGSIAGALTYPISMTVVGKNVATIIVAALTAALVLIMHRKNICALCNGTERKIGKTKPKGASV